MKKIIVFWGLLYVFGCCPDALDDLGLALTQMTPIMIKNNLRNQLLQQLKTIISEPLVAVVAGSLRDRILDAYVNQVSHLHKLYDLSNPLPTGGIRIVTYNVHYWADPYSKSCVIDDMLHVIATVNADVVCLQEVSWGKSTYNTKYATNDLVTKMRGLGYGYGGDDTFVQVGHFFGAPFGNMIFSKYDLKNIMKVLYKDGTRGFVAGTIDYKGTPLRIYCTHLDVWDKTGKTRKEEITEFVAHVNTHDPKNLDVFIAGDFNEAREQDYEPDVWNKLKSHNENKRKELMNDEVSQVLHASGFKDAYETVGHRFPFTCWTGTTVDFGYLRQGGKWKIEDVSLYFDATSDHLPVIFDVKVG